MACENDRQISLEQRKEIMTDMMRFFFAFCEEKGLRCRINGGTLIGAVRHKGYIPWDDDVDISMPISDYNRLIELVKDGALGPHYFLSSPKSNENHMWPILKVIDTKTIMVEPSLIRSLTKAQSTFYGVYLDIFPVYGLPEDANERALFQEKITRLYGDFMKSSRVMNRRAKDGFLLYRLRCLLYWAYTFRQKCIGWKTYLRKIEEMTNAYPLNGATYFGFMVGMASGTRDTFRTALLDDCILLDFERIKAPSVAGYDEMLRIMYGDYMELPPAEQRRTHGTDVRWK